MFRLNIYVILGTVFFSTLVSYYFNHSFNKLVWINTLFSFSLILTLIGGAMLVIQGGFFSGIIRSFKLFFWKTNPIKQVLEDIEGKREDTNPYLLTFTLTFPLLFSGTLLLLFSIIFSWYIS
jgi:hypothetical protein